MKLIEIVNLNDNKKQGRKFAKSLFVLFGVLFLGSFLMMLTINFLNLEIGYDDTIRFTGIWAGMIIGIYLGMCIQKSNFKWRKNE